MDSTPLLTAMYNNKSKAAKFLIEKGADITNSTLLHLAICSDMADIANLLIERKTIIDSLDETGKTPLHWACQNGNSVMTKILIGAGANVNMTDYMNATPLHYAIHNDIYM